MGRDISQQTIGFLEVGDAPKLKLYKSSTGQMIILESVSGVIIRLKIVN